MAFVELRRLRTWTIWWALIVVAIATIITLTGINSTLDVNGTRVDAAAGFVMPLSLLTPIAMFLAAIFATSAGLSLCKESTTLDLTWTKPLSRAAMGARYLGVDAAMTALAYAFAWIVALAVAVSLHVRIATDGDVGPTLVLSIGVAMMWLGLIAVLTAGFSPKASMIAGIVWPVALTFSGLTGLHGVFGAMVGVVNVFNPLAYLSSVSPSHGGAAVKSFWLVSMDVRIAAVWGLALLYAAVAIALWSRREA